MEGDVMARLSQKQKWLHVKVEEAFEKFEG